MLRLPASRIARRRSGMALVGAGAVLVTWAGLQYAHGAVGAERMRSEWEIARARSAVEEIRGGAMTVAGRGVAVGAPIARLRIPGLGLDEIVVEGVGERELNVGPGHLPGSAIPGEPGNAVISAHRDRHFLALGDLAVGDTIHTEVGVRETGWVVTSRRVVRAGAPALFATEEPTLTLTTCWPIRFFGSAPDRLIVTARRLDAPEGPARS